MKTISNGLEPQAVASEAKLSLFGKLGWIAAVALGSIFIAGGFAQKAEKVGVVDITQAFAKSSLKQKHEDKLAAMTEARKGVLDFVGLNPTFTADQLKRFRVLSLQEKLTPADKTELDGIKTSVQTATKDYEALRQKPSPTPDDVKKLEDFGARAAFSKQSRQQLQEEFIQEMSAARDGEDNAAFLSIRDAIREVGKNQGFSIVFSERAAVYGSTDITDDVQKLADKKGN
jgi:Skp family chaperone for outer membrane proteins